jgi:hypothetical protein
VPINRNAYVSTGRFCNHHLRPLRFGLGCFVGANGSVRHEDSSELLQICVGDRPVVRPATRASRPARELSIEFLSKPHQPTTMAPPTTRQAKRDLWTRVVEGMVHVVEVLCPALERTLSWDFKDCGLIALEVRGSLCSVSCWLRRLVVTGKLLWDDVGGD